MGKNTGQELKRWVTGAVRRGGTRGCSAAGPGLAGVFVVRAGSICSADIWTGRTPCAEKELPRLLGWWFFSLVTKPTPLMEF